MNNRDIELINLNYEKMKEQILFIIKTLNEVNVEKLLFAVAILKTKDASVEFSKYQVNTKLLDWLEKNKINKTTIINNYYYYKKYIKYILIEISNEIKYEEGKIIFTGNENTQRKEMQQLINLTGKAKIYEIREVLNENR